jgi:putative heme-binding domain-containing protein
VKLAAGIHNDDGILGTPLALDMNFYQGRFRVWTKEQKDAAVSTKPMTPDLWTHLAVTRDVEGNLSLYQNGELDAKGSKVVKQDFKDCRIGWTQPKSGTKGSITQFRVWQRVRTAEEIRANFDRALPEQPDLCAKAGSKMMARTTDYPPILTPEQAAALDQKFHRYSQLAQKKPDLEMGKTLSALCMACHQIGAAGGQIGPNLSAVGSMGTEAILRNILTPNAAMEPGYRIFRMEMVDGAITDAFFVSESPSSYVVRMPGAADQSVPKAKVKHTSYLRRSLMPEGLLDALSDEQVTHLLGYLMSLK